MEEKSELYSGKDYSLDAIFAKSLKHWLRGAVSVWCCVIGIAPELAAVREVG